MKSFLRKSGPGRSFQSHRMGCCLYAKEIRLNEACPRFSCAPPPASRAGLTGHPEHVIKTRRTRLRRVSSRVGSNFPRADQAARTSYGCGTANIRRGPTQNPCSSLAAAARSEVRPYAQMLKAGVEKRCVGRGTETRMSLMAEDPYAHLVRSSCVPRMRFRADCNQSSGRLVRHADLGISRMGSA